jgi:hypothetical protein
MADFVGLSYVSFHESFRSTFFALLREILDGAIKNPDPSRNDLSPLLERFRDVLIVHETFISLD